MGFISASDIITKVKDNKERRIGYAFVSTVLIGIIAHLQFLANDLHNHDSVRGVMHEGSQLLTQGKWFVNPLTKLFGEVDVIYTVVLAGIIYCALAAVILCLTFDIKNRASIALMGGILVVFSSVATEALYHSNDYFCAAFMLAVLGGCLIIQDNIVLCVIGIVPVCLSIGAYQANISVAAVIIIIDLCLRLFGNEDLKFILKRVLRNALATAVSLISYYIILQVLLKLNAVELSDYKDINTMETNLLPATLVRSAIQAYRDFCGFVFMDKLALGEIGIFIPGILITVISIVLVLWFAKLSGAIAHPGKVVLGIVAIVILGPLSANAIGILSGNRSFYYICCQAFCLCYLFPLAVYERICQYVKEADAQFKTIRIAGLITGIMLIYMIAHWNIQNNLAYQKARVIEREVNAEISVLTAGIYGTEGYELGNRVVFAGNPPWRFLEPWGGMPSYPGGGGYAISEDSNAFVGGPGGLIAVMVYEQMLAMGYDEYDGVSSWPEYASELNEMPVYPDEGSIRKIGDKIVVKLSDDLGGES